MDEIVEAALRKWPNVPHCTGWLGLDARGGWWLRDARTQAGGDFPDSRGSPVSNERLRGFIERNYAHDAQGCWFFQNGPQRVYVELEAAPIVWRVHARGGGDFVLAAHHGPEARAIEARPDEQGRLFVASDLGFGIVHSLDMEVAARALDAGAWPLKPELPFAQMPERFGYVRSPARHPALVAQRGSP